MHSRIKDDFIIILPAADVVQLFGEKLKLSCIVEVPQSHCRLHLILKLSANPDVGIPSVNNTTNREAAPESLQFGRAFHASCRQSGGRTCPGSSAGV